MSGVCGFCFFFHYYHLCKNIRENVSLRSNRQHHGLIFLLNVKSVLTATWTQSSPNMGSGSCSWWWSGVSHWINWFPVLGDTGSAEMTWNWCWAADVNSCCHGDSVQQGDGCGLSAAYRRSFLYFRNLLSDCSSLVSRQPVQSFLFSSSSLFPLSLSSRRQDNRGGGGGGGGGL